MRTALRGPQLAAHCCWHESAKAEPEKAMRQNIAIAASNLDISSSLCFACTSKIMYS
jgi:hypothetical protein